MMEPRKYATAAAFRRALEDRLREVSLREGPDIQRLRRQVAFDRLLARLFAEVAVPWVLTGKPSMSASAVRSRTRRTATSRTTLSLCLADG